MVRYEETPKGVKIVGAASSMEGITAEYTYIARQLGEKGRDWDLVMQALLMEDGVQYDELNVRLASGEERTYRFDISEFFGIEVRSGQMAAPPEQPKGCLGGVIAALLQAAGVLSRGG
jgi:hypothetical protein